MAKVRTSRPPAFEAPYMLGRASFARTLENVGIATGLSGGVVCVVFACLGFGVLDSSIDPTAMLCVSAAGLGAGMASVVLLLAAGLAFSESMTAAGDALGEFAEELEARKGAEEGFDAMEGWSAEKIGAVGGREEAMADMPKVDAESDGLGEKTEEFAME